MAIPSSGLIGEAAATGLWMVTYPGIAFAPNIGARMMPAKVIRGRWPQKPAHQLASFGSRRHPCALRAHIKRPAASVSTHRQFAKQVATRQRNSSAADPARAGHAAKMFFPLARLRCSSARHPCTPGIRIYIVHKLIANLSFSIRKIIFLFPNSFSQLCANSSQTARPQHSKIRPIAPKHHFPNLTWYFCNSFHFVLCSSTVSPRGNQKNGRQLDSQTFQ